MSRKKEVASFGIIGLGRFGTALAKELAEAGKEVIVVDNNENKVKELRAYTEHAYVADELTREVLEEIGIGNCDTVVVCIGEKIDRSILVTLNVVNLGVSRVIAKAISLDHGAVLKKIGAEVVYPESDMALRLAKRLLWNNVIDYISLTNNIEISEVHVTERIQGMSVVDLDVRKVYGLNIIAIEHQGRTDIEINPDYILEKDDILLVIGLVDNINRFEASLVS